MLLGMAIAWVEFASDGGHASSSAVSPGGVLNATRLMGGYPPQTSFREIGARLPEMGPHITVVMPVALTVAVGTIQCVQFAQKAGDAYPLRASMIGDGAATIVSALFGGIFGMTVYIGAPPPLRTRP
jgi:adenine/guanine/hypoxanthine permease